MALSIHQKYAAIINHENKWMDFDKFYIRIDIDYIFGWDWEWANFAIFQRSYDPRLTKELSFRLQ